ncbi:cysteine peptidase family C39 domain-containing protein [Cupriavidus sp. IK-TO18]|uniref:cysteine peptidase family C39 domain-containing protein n=1 Tax=Cupriavidus sp. IK-TO18 TaxID=2782182 RepID=UPI002103A0B6|nr:cysteine peptidase family C39 domain-containing protein [Cupriavidus sp. IK-TO18]
MAGHREPAGGDRLTGADDPLLGCLLLLNRVWQRPIPTGVLKELPHRLTLPQLGDAAAHAGLSTRLAEMELDTIPDRVLPVILLLHKRRPCVLLERREHGRLLVALPGWGGGEQEVSRDELLAQYSRYAILVQPLSQAEGRAETQAEMQAEMQAEAQAETQAEGQADMEPAQPGRSTGTATRPSWRHHWDRLTASAHKVFRSRRRRRADEAAVIRS